MKTSTESRAVKAPNHEPSPFKMDANALTLKFGQGAMAHLDLGTSLATQCSSVDTFLSQRGRMATDFAGRRLQLVAGEEVGLSFTKNPAPVTGHVLLISAPSI